MKLSSAFLILLLIAIPPVTHADDIDYDFVIIVDNSGSMRATDPNGHRKNAAKFFASMLNKKDRIAIIDFSSKADLVFKLSAIKNDVTLNQLYHTIDLMKPSGQTNFHEALLKSIATYGNKPTGKRGKIIILFSDGYLNVGSQEKNQNYTDRIKQKVLPMIKNRAIKIFSIAFTDYADKAFLKNLSEETQGSFFFSRTTHEIYLAFLTIYEQLNKPDALLFENDAAVDMITLKKHAFHIDKLISEITLIIYHDNSSDAKNIELVTPEQQKIKLSSKHDNIRWMSTRNFYVITITKPAHGKWKLFNPKNPLYDLKRIYVISNLQLKSDFYQQHFIYGKNNLISVWLEDNNKFFHHKDIHKHLSMHAEISTSNAKKQALLLLDNGTNGDKTANDGIYSFYFNNNHIGRFQLQLTVKSATFNRVRLFHSTIKQPPPKADHAIKSSIPDEKTVIPPETVPADKSDKNSNQILKWLIINLLIFGILFIIYKRFPLFHQHNK